MRCSFAQNGCTVLHTAVYFGHHSIVGMLLDAGADTNSTDRVSAALPSFPLPQSIVGPLTLGRQAHVRKQHAAEQQACVVRCVEQWWDIHLQCTKHDYFMCRVAPLL